MKLKLNTSTKEAFESIISSLGMDKVLLVLHQFLAEGLPMGIEKFAELMDLTVPAAITLGENKGELNTNDELVGFLGLSLVPTNHQMIIGGKKFYTWCAADTLIFPAILKINATVTSTDPVTNEKFEVSINQDHLVSISPPGAMISWIDNVDDNDIRCSMCNRVHFFANGSTAKKWHEDNSDARIFKVTDYFTTDISRAKCC